MRALLAIFLTIVSTLVFAASDKTKALIIHLVGPGAIITDEFQSVGNLNGYIVKKDKDSAPFIVYADRDGKYVINGTVYDANSQDLLALDKPKYLFQKNATQEMLNIAKTGHVIQSKESAPIKHAMTIIIEPNCSACHALYQAMLPYIQSGDLSVRWVLVHFLREDSEAKAAAILQAPDPIAALQANEASFNDAQETGGAKAATTIKPETKEKLKASIAFMANIGINATPAIIYYDKTGKLQIVEGFPQDKQALTSLINNASDQFDKKSS